MSGEGLIPDRPIASRLEAGKSDRPAQTAEGLPPLVSFSEAEAIGVALHDHMEKHLGSVPMDRDDMGWGDLVQFVLRRASETVRDREEGSDECE